MTKKKKKEDLHKAGRKSILDTDPIVVSKLESAFAIGADVSLACAHAGISRQTYYEFIRKNPEFADRYELIRKKPILKALNTVVGGLEDVNTAKWYLERKLKNEFSPREEITGADGSAIATYDLSKLDKQTLLEMADRAGVTDDTAEQS